jgi:hypothetical protein
MHEKKLGLNKILINFETIQTRLEKKQKKEF